MKKTKQKRKPSPSFPQVSGRTFTARLADSLSRGGTVTVGGSVVRAGEFADGEPLLTVAPVERQARPPEFDLDAPALNEGETGVPPDSSEGDGPFVPRFDWVSVFRAQLTHSKPDLSADQLDKQARQMATDLLASRLPTRRPAETNGRMEAEKARLRATFSANRAREREAVNRFAVSVYLIVKGYLSASPLSAVDGFAPVVSLLSLCPLVAEDDALAIFSRLLTDDGLENAIIRTGRNQHEALLFAWLDDIRDLQNKRARSTRKRIIRAHKRKRRGKRK